MRENLIWLPWKWAEKKTRLNVISFKQFEWVIWKGKRRKKPVSNDKQKKNKENLGNNRNYLIN